MSRLFADRPATLAAVAVLFAIEAVIRFRGHLSSDVAWYLYAGGRLLDGGVLYVDIVEINPPLGLWLAVPIVAAARLLGVSSIAALYVAILGLTALSIALSARLLSAATDISSGARNLVVVVLAALMLFLPAADFGQRDHLFILLAAPWLLLRWNRLAGCEVPLKLAAVVGGMAAVAFCLKAHYVVALLAVEVVVMFGTRDIRSAFRIENLIIVTVGVIYWSAVSILFTRFLSPLYALSVQAFVPYYGFSFGEIAQALVLPTALGIAAIASSSFLGETFLLLRTLLVVVGSALLAIFVVQAGYRHQLIPGLFFMSLATSLGVARVVAGDVRVAGVGGGAAALASAVAILFVFASACIPQSSAYRGDTFEKAIDAEAPRASTIFIASTDVRHPFPLVEERGLVWASRYPAQWLAPHAAASLAPGGTPADYISREVLDATISDLVNFAPDILFVDERKERPNFKGVPLDYVEFWRSDARFKPFWESYERRGAVDGFGIYVRVGEGGS